MFKIIVLVLGIVELIRFSQAFFIESSNADNPECFFRNDELGCALGHYTDVCGKRKCYRLPGQQCDMPSDQIYNAKCHSSLSCACGLCYGCTHIGGQLVCDNNRTCPHFKNYRYQKKQSKQPSFEYNY